MKAQFYNKQCRLNLNLERIDSLINTTEFKSNVNLHIYSEQKHGTRLPSITVQWLLLLLEIDGLFIYLFSASSHLKISVISSVS